MRPRFAFLLFPVFAALATVPFAGCESQGEGKPCDPNAGNTGNDDCQPPLVCTTGLNTGANSARCCPQNRATATTSECAISSTTASDASPAPPDALTDTSSPEGASPDASRPEAAADGPATEAGPETAAGTDASDGAISDGGTSDASSDGPGE